MSYNQYMKHWGNHRKDKVFQQCSGYFGKSLDELRAEEAQKQNKYFIVDRDDNIIDCDVNYENIILKAKKIKCPDDFFIRSNEMLMGRIDLVLSSCANGGK